MIGEGKKTEDVAVVYWLGGMLHPFPMQSGIDDLKCDVVNEFWRERIERPLFLDLGRHVSKCVGCRLRRC